MPNARFTMNLGRGLKAGLGVSKAYWSLSQEELFQLLESKSSGLSQQDAEGRLQRTGSKTVKAHEAYAAVSLLLGQFKDPLILILIFAAVISAFVGEWVDAGVVFLVIIGSAILSFSQEYRAGRAVKKLLERVQTRATVLRDGEAKSIPVETLVPGDVISLSAGNLIPADGIILHAKACYVDEAALTGETFPVEKTPSPVAENASLSERRNSVFMGTSVRSGTAQALIVHTGEETAFGNIAKRLSLRRPETEFERGIRQFGYLLSQIVLIFVLFVFAINVFAAKPPIDSLLFAIALAVGLAPELLPAIISITLSTGAQKMAEEGVIVRRLNAIENFGIMDLLCTDKTGTLTQGTVQLGDSLDATGQSSKEIFTLAWLNAHFQLGIANPLDTAILAFGSVHESPYEKLDEIPYDFERRRLSIIVSQSDNEALLICKGALEKILEVSRFIKLNEQIIPIESSHIEDIEGKFAAWSSQGFRVLGLATKALPKVDAYNLQDENELCFRGFLLFFDPPKADVAKTIQDLAKLGVQLKIISGDNRYVSQYIAEEVGLPITGILTGEELNELRDEAFWQIAERTTLFVEVDLNQKERIIRSLQKMGHVVGYMGDGINDAPALHVADVGISVDQAVDVAKEAADFVLLEHSLSALHDGIINGRKTFANTLKYIFTTTSANFGNMFSMAGLSVFLPFLPLLAKQILLNNFLSDFPGMAIANDNVDDEMITKPHRWDMKLVRNFMILFGLVSSVFDYLTFAFLLWIVQATPAEFRTAWFIESLLTELAIALVVRSRQPFYKSKAGKWLVISTLAVAIFTLLLPYLPINTLFDFVPLPLPLMMVLLLITVAYVFAAEIAKKYFYQALR
jgi:Mg2+-importing ATPase